MINTLFLKKSLPLFVSVCTIGLVLTGCGSKDSDVQRYSWPLATASPGRTLLHRSLLKNLLKKWLHSVMAR